MDYDIIIIGAGPGGIYSAYELTKEHTDLKIAVFEAGNPLEKRRCPIDGEKVTSCIRCKTCAIMSGFGGAGAFSDGKYNITNNFGGTLYEHVGRQTALDLMNYVDHINTSHGAENTKLYSTAGTRFKKLCLQNKLHLLDASIRHLGTDLNYVVLENLYKELKDKVDFYFNTPVSTVEVLSEGFRVVYGIPLRLQKMCHLCRPQRKQMDGICLPPALHSYLVQPGRPGSPGGASRSDLFPSHR